MNPLFSNDVAVESGMKPRFSNSVDEAVKRIAGIKRPSSLGLTTIIVHARSPKLAKLWMAFAIRNRKTP